MELKEFKTTVIPLRIRLLHYAKKLTEDEFDAEDVVQEVMLKLWNQRKTLDQCNSIEAYAVRITHNCAIDLIRSRKEPTVSLDDCYNELSRNGTPEDDLEKKDEKSIIRHLMALLPPLQRMTIELKDIQGYENHEIAEIMGCQEEAIRSNLSRGRKKIRDQYLEYIKQGRRKAI